ncbi:hypothetical protein HDV05_005116 [Chytridiales sp. JEL 0842]|nr:hypothetical protein HDV05_005116 [Chytridiales sp. JEL 0842]
MTTTKRNHLGAIVAIGTAVVGTATLVYYYWDKAIGQPLHVRQKLPLPRKNVPFLGCLVEYTTELHRLHDEFLENFEEIDNRTMVRNLPFHAPIIFFNDPVILEHVLKTNFTSYEKGQYFSSRGMDILGHGIFNVDNELWRSQRKIAANIFNVKNFKEYVGVAFVEEMESFKAKLDSYADTEQVVDLADLFFRYTLDAFCKVAFGADVNTMHLQKKTQFAVSFDAVQVRFLQRFLIPWWKLEEEYTSVGTTQKMHVDVLRKFGERIVNDRRARMLNETTSEDSKDKEESTTGTKQPVRSSALYGDADLLSLLMKLKTDDGQELTDDTLIDYIMNFIIAGRDTTAQVLSWTFYCLHQHPKVLEKLLQEIQETLGDTHEATYEQVKSMKYANAVFLETLRLYPSVPAEVKEAVADDVWPDGTIIKKGMLVAWNVYAMGRTKAIWGEDAKEFKPERWIGSLQPSPFNYPVFNGGPRTCLGKDLAKLEGVYVLVALLVRYRVEVVSEHVTYASTATLPVKDGLKVKIYKRV